MYLFKMNLKNYRHLTQVFLLYNGNVKVCWSKNLPPTITDNNFSPSINWYGDLYFCLVFKGSCLKQKTETFTPPNPINPFTVYKLDIWSRDLNSGCLFGVVKLAKNTDPDK